MCKECLQTPCDSRCPNAPEPNVMGRCAQCGEELREDYEYYIDNFDNEFCCEDCALEYYGVEVKVWQLKEDEF